MQHETKLHFIAIALSAILLAGVGLALLGSAWLSTAGDETAALNRAALHCFRSLRERAEAARPDHSPRHVGGPDEGPRPGSPRGDGHGPRGDGHGPRGGGRWHTPILENLQRWCNEVSDAAAVDGFAFEIVDAEGVRLCVSPRFPESVSAFGEVELSPPFGRGVLRTARASGAVSPIRSKARRMILIGICIVLLVAATLYVFAVSLLRTVRREREDSRRKADFIDNVSHELNTPLAGIRLNAELLAENRIPDEERRRGALESILIESDRLSRMVSELLDYSRLEKGTRRYAVETFDLAAFASDAAEAQAVAAISNGRARVSVRSGTMVSADKDALRQIATNLVANAVKYSDGEIDIEIEGNEIRFMDRGRGIPHECAERIFERFYRVDNSLTRRVNGSGLGLPIARALARGMGGDVTYSPRPGGGSVFILTLACADKNNGGVGK